MTARRSKLARGAWIALLVLFAVRAVAGSVLCELCDEHRPPPGNVHPKVEASPRTHSHAGHELHSASESPASVPTEHVCDEPVYLADELASDLIGKLSSCHDEFACDQWAFAVLRPEVTTAGSARQQQTHPPPSRTALDISRRLRI